MTDKKTEALKLALEWDKRRKYIMPYVVRDAIREALAEQPAQQQEPVAWMSAHRFEQLRQGFTVMTTLTKQKAFEDDVALYTSPPASKPWVGLTEEERTEIRSKVQVYTSMDNIQYGLAIQHATETMLKEKNT